MGAICEVRSTRVWLSARGELSASFWLESPTWRRSRRLFLYGTGRLSDVGSAVISPRVRAELARRANAASAILRPLRAALEAALDPRFVLDELEYRASGRFGLRIAEGRSTHYYAYDARTATLVYETSHPEEVTEPIAVFASVPHAAFAGASELALVVPAPGSIV